jgi:D-alanyl-D-alanine carboxypeptidase (penicillin-binding protein 5/6)
MNEKAAQLGMRDSHFTTPVGLDEPGMKSSAYDLGVAASKIVTSYPDLLTISGTPDIKFPQTGTHKLYDLQNYNRLVKPSPAPYRGATGMKTAFTNDAGPCMVATAQRGHRRLVVVILHSADFFTDAAALLDYGFAVNP